MRTAVVLLVVALTLSAGTEAVAEKEKHFVQPQWWSRSLLDCADAIPISCYDVVTGTNVGAPGNVESYSCVGWLEGGGEVIYELVLDASVCYKVTAELSEMACDLDVFILGSCDEADCLAFGNTLAETQCLGPGTYYIVVDGYGEADCEYTLSVSCEECECAAAECCPVDYTCYEIDFGVSTGGFTTELCQGAAIWEWGIPVGLPATACDGIPVTNVLGTVLGGNYLPNAGERAIVGPFDLTDECTCLELCHFYDIETGGYDGGNVKISADGGATWDILFPARLYDRDASTWPSCVPEEPILSGHQFNTEFLRDCFDLTDYIGSEVLIAFDFGADGSVQYPGWYIQRLRIGGDQSSSIEDSSWGGIKSKYR